jgi:hypothetical protein
MATASSVSDVDTWIGPEYSVDPVLAGVPLVV